MKPTIVFGSHGMLGRTIIKLSHLFPCDVLEAVIGPEEIDITDRESVDEFLSDADFDCVVNCAAITDVDRCEEEVESAKIVNSQGPKILAAAVNYWDTPLIHISTDHVFDGTTPPYTEESKPNPINVYGKTKLGGERAVLEADKRNYVLRTSWTFGLFNHDFPTRLLARYEKGERKFEVVYDVIGTPTYTEMVVRGIITILNHPKWPERLWHMSNYGKCSKYQLAKETFEIVGIDDVKIVPVPSSKFPTTAPRPKDSTMLCSNLLKYHITPPHYREDLKKYLMLVRKERRYNNVNNG